MVKVVKGSLVSPKPEELLTRVPGMIAFALEAAKMGTWEWDIIEDRVVGDESLSRLFGFNEKKLVQGTPLEKFLELIHPDDRTQVREYIETVIKTGETYDAEYRLVNKKGKVRWVMARGRVEYDESGKAVRFPGVLVDITERKKAHDSLVKSQEIKRQLKKQADVMTKERAQLLEINKAKEDFISLASHQLRTPATAVKQYIGMLQAGMAGELTENQLVFLNRAYDSNERQLKIVDALLKVALVDAGKVKVMRQNVNLMELMRDVIQDQSSTLLKHHQQVVFKPGSDSVIASVDPGLFRMALDNFLSNASRYTKSQKRIKVELKEQKSSITIAITDEGIGIDNKDLPKLFNKFSRIDNPLSSTVGGAGLGLYWAKKIIDLHGGSVEVKSKLNKGSTFVITLPTKEPL